MNLASPSTDPLAGTEDSEGKTKSMKDGSIHRKYAPSSHGSNDEGNAVSTGRKSMRSSSMSFRMRFFSRSGSSSKSFSQVFDESTIMTTPEISLEHDRFKLISHMSPDHGGYLWRKGRMKSGWKKAPDYYQIRSSVLLQFRLKRGMLGFRQKQRLYNLYRVVELKYCNFRRWPGEEPVLCLTHSQYETDADVLLAAYDEFRLEGWLAALRRACRPIALADFTPLAKIGEGEWGSVLVARYGDGVLAVKEIEINPQSNPSHLIQERETLCSIPKFPFIVNLHSAFRLDSHLYFALDFAPGGDLFTRMQRARPSKGEAVLYAAEILLALEHLHAHGIVYRDLKPENILLGADGHILLADMGLAKKLAENEYAHTFCGTESYLAPEIIHRLPYRMTVDFWQYGCLVFELYCGRSPFWKPRHLRKNLHQIITKGIYKFPASVPDAAKVMVKDLLQVNPSLRAGYGQGGWADVKSYDYFRRTSFEALLANGNKPAERITQQSVRRYLENFDRCFTGERPSWKSESAIKIQTPMLHEELMGFDIVRDAPAEEAAGEDLEEENYQQHLGGLEKSNDREVSGRRGGGGGGGRGEAPLPPPREEGPGRRPDDAGAGAGAGEQPGGHGAPPALQPPREQAPEDGM
ncbi:unnamed protein product [Heterosigma akashiwo]|mmetsp:Transcript_36446/g.63568  ORF Transcript_36446/g.63568 Transcript_36446/m.63568 type:complete len:635 (-) Transcript_36446:307-2211(-)|eukprot:CAMPEP_0194570176 /NCGR_PEP_ID=MMETSP0292-20121207/7594_1 /TAXON_ID=39354 /ORGANISM="Heterosigma akashiwo, Strain CCMP2393" /LENGTH=634 /DNA_ID=CAMNT_0039420569 /DNA_START=244 /DNA_END=2148 /DNA_ORIENTATION=-